MKKVLVGCGVIFILLVMILTSLGVWGFRTARRVGTEIQSARTDLESTNKAFPFKAPADGQLTEAQLTAWLKVRGAFAARDRQRVAGIKNPLDALRAMTHLPETDRGYVQDLHAAKMSAAEVDWITDQVMGALKSRAAARNPKTGELAALIDQPDPALRQGAGPRGRRGGGMRFERPQVAPLAVEDARPILDLLLKHEAEFRRVAYPIFADGFIHDALRRQRTAARTANRTTTATGTASRATTATLEKTPGSAWDQAPWTTATTHK